MNCYTPSAQPPEPPLNLLTSPREDCLAKSFICFPFLPPNLPPPAELQGVSWDGPCDVGRAIPETPTEDEPLYAVPRKDHLPKFTLDDFILHKMLGKGSFGKVK